MEFIEKFKSFLLAPAAREGISRSRAASKTTVKNYLADVKHFIDWVESAYKQSFSPALITIQMIRAFEDEKKKVLSANSVDRHLSSLRKFFTFLKTTGEISKSPFDQATSYQLPATDPWHLHDFKNYLYVYNSSHLTIKNYIIDVKQFLSWAEEVLRVENAWQIGEKDVLKKIDNKIVEEYKQRLLHEKIFSPASINRKLSSLRKYLGWAGENGFLSQISNIQYQISNINPEGKYQRGGATGDPARVPATSLQVKPSERGEESTGPLDSGQARMTIQSSRPYSNIPPIRLFQKLAKTSTFTFDLLITAPVAHLFRNIEHETWKIKGKKVFFQDTRCKIQDTKNFKNFKLKIKNYSKEFIRPLSISTNNFSWYQKALHHIRYTRPEWYRRYHRLAIAQYFNWAVLIIFSTAVGFGMYNNFFAKAPGSLATAPTVTTPIRVLSFQGRLTDANDNPITTASNLRFIIYNAQSSSSSARLWEEVDKVTPDSNGIFSLLLGSSGASDGSAASLCNSGNPPTSPATGVCGIPSTLFANNNALWLGITVEATSELSPREQLATVAFASNAETLQGLQPIGASTHTNVVLALNSSGNLDVGASTTFESTSGQFAISGNTVAINTNTGTAGDISLYPDGMGYIDLNRPIRTTTNNSNIASIPNSVEVDSLLGVLATSSGQSAFTVVQNGAGPIISASAGATPKLTLQNDGTLILPKYNTADGVLIMANDTTGTIAQTAQGAAHTFLRGNGAGAPTFNSIDLSTSDIGTSILGVADGGTGTNLSSGAAVGDLLYADSTTTFHRLADVASGSCLLSGGVTTAPSWGSCSSATNYWQIQSKVVSPADLNNDLAVGGNSTSSAKFQVFAESVGPVVAGTASTSGNLTFSQAHGTNPAINILNGNSLNFDVSPNGDSGTGYITALTLSNNATAISLSTSSNNPLSILAGTGTITLGTSGTGGNIQFFSSSNTISNSGNLTLAGTITLPNSIVLTGAASKLSLNQGLLTNTANGAATQTSIDTSGNVLPGSDGGANLGASATAWGTLFVKNIQLPIAGGLGGYWNLNSGVLAPANIQNDLTIGGSATTSARFHAYGTVNQGTTPSASASANSSFATVVVDNSGTGDLFTASTSGLSKFTILNSGSVKDSNYTTDKGVIFSDSNGLFTQTAQGASNTVLHGNGSSAPTFSAVSLTADVTGVLPLNKGGTNGNLTANAGGIVWSDASQFQILAGTATSGLCLTSGSNATPAWSSCSSASNNYWQLNGKAVSPADLNNDLEIGGNATSSAKFQVFAETVGADTAGQATTSAGFTFGDAAGTNPPVDILNGNTLTFKTSPGGDAVLTNALLVGPNAIQFYSSSNQITSGGALTIASNFTINGTTETFGGASGNINTGSNVLTLNNGGSGNIDFFGTGNVITSTGNLTLAGNITLSPNSGNSITSVSNFAQFSNGISVNGGTTYYIDKNGNANLNSLNLPLAGGIGGYWQLSTGATTYGVLAPINTQSDLAIGGAATSSATFQVYGQQFKTDSAINSGNILSGTATSSGNFVFRAASGSNIGIQYLNGSNFVIWKSPGGDKGLSAILTLDNGGNVTVANNLSVNGNIATSLVPTANTLNLGSANTSWGTLYVNNIQSPITGGLSGYWQLSSGATTYGVLAATNIQNDLAIGGAATSSATFQVYGQQFKTDASINSGNITSGTATTSGNLTFRGTAGNQTVFQENILNGANLGFYNSVGGDKGITNTAPLLYLANSDTVGINTNNPQGILDVASQGKLFPSDLILNQVATSNLLTNPSFENNSSTGWVLSANETVSSDRALFGSDSLKFSGTSASEGSSSPCVNVTNGTTYTASEYIYRVSGFSGNTGMFVNYYTNNNCVTAGSTTSQVNVTTTNTWTRLNVSFTGATGSIQSVRLRTIANGSATGTAYYDGVQLEQGSLSPYLDGSLGPGYHWTGAANNSASVRDGGAAFAYQTINSAGGIGAASKGFTPTLQLDQDGTGDIFTASASGVTELQLTSAGNLAARKFSDYDSQTYFLDPAATSLTPALQIAGDASGGANLVFTAANTGILGSTANQPTIQVLNNADLHFDFTSSTGNNSSFNTAMTIKNNGNVGIGTKTPAYPLEIAGGSVGLTNGTSNIIYYGSTGVAAPGSNTAGEKLQLNGTAGSTAASDYAIGIESGNMWFNVPSGAGYKWYRNAVAQMVFDSSGRLGIANTSPTEKLDITGNASESGNLTFRGTNTTHNINILDGGNLSFNTSVGGNETGQLNPALYIGEVNTATASAFIGINNTNPSRNLDVNGSWGGNEYTLIDSTDTNHTDKITTPALYYFFSCTATGSTVTINFNITGIPNTNGSWFMIHARSGSTACILNLQVNGANVDNGIPFSNSNNFAIFAYNADYTPNWIMVADLRGDAAYDLSELIPFSSPQPIAGEILTPDINNASPHIAHSVKEYDQKAVGIVTTNPAIIFGQENNGFGNYNSTADAANGQIGIALTGRVPTMVTSLNGPIVQGDSITTSPLAGVGMEPTKPTQTVGKALEPFNPLDGTITCTQASSYSTIVWPSDDGSNNAHPCFQVPVSSYDAATQAILANEYHLGPNDYVFVGKVMVLVGNGYVDPDVYLTTTGDVNITDSSPSADFAIPHYYTLSDTLGAPLTRMGRFLELAIGNLRVGSINAQQILTNSLAITTDNVSIAGVSLHDYIASIVSQMVNSQSSIVNSPVAEVAQLHTNLISPLASNSAVAISLDNSGINIQNTFSQQTVARIDSTGNATFSGQLKSQNLAVQGDATVSGTLYADKIKANSIEGLSEVVSTLSAQNITNVTNIFFATPSGSTNDSKSTIGSNDLSNSNNIVPNELASNQQLVASTSGTLPNYQLPTTNYASIASYSSYFAYVPNLNATTGIFQQGLVSLGPTSLSDTSITGSLSIGSQLILADTSINVLGSDFAIQPLRQGGVNFEGGLIAIDTSGNLTVNGNAIFNKGLATNVISPISGNDLTIQLGNSSHTSSSNNNNSSSSVARSSQFDIQNASGSGIFNIDQLGNVVASGEATIGKLNLNLVQPALALSQTEVVATGSAGTATINAYQHEVTIDDPNVTANSLIYITPVGTNQTPYLERQISGKSFSVGVPVALPQAVNFNWLIVN